MMGYLNTSSTKVKDFNKAVISLWFRVSKASLQACYDHYIGRISGGDAPASLWGILPVMTFGGPLTQPFFIDQEVQLDGPPENPDTPSTIVTFVRTAIEDVYLDPSVIGINVANFPSSIAFIARFQSTATCERNAYQVVSAAWTNPGNVQSCALNPVATGPQSFNITVQLGAPENFVDAWHHVLISCDLSRGVSCLSSDTIADSVISYNRLWIAIDDVNYTEDAAFDYWVEGSSDPNAVITVDSMDVASKGSPPYSLPTALAKGAFVDFVWNPNVLSDLEPDPSTGATGNTPLTATVAATPIPISVHPVGVPSTADQTDNIFKVDMAECQMFTGVSLETGVVGNRRAFIDANLQPVMNTPNNLPYDPTDPLATPITAPPSEPIALLGKVPDIAFVSSSSNWQKGINLGSGGGFLPTGTIKPFIPDPKVGR